MSTFPAYSVKSQHHRLDVLTIFQRGALGVHGVSWHTRNYSGANWL